MAARRCFYLDRRLGIARPESEAWRNSFRGVRPPGPPEVNEDCEDCRFGGRWARV